MTDFDIRKISVEELFTLSCKKNAEALYKFADYPVKITKGTIMNDLKQHQIYVQVILEGCSVDFGLLSICDLSKCAGVFREGYQVYCDAHRVKQDLIYDDIDEAVKEFLELKQRLSK